jgi:Mg2+ and Co2+ transporter CorA
LIAHNDREVKGKHMLLDAIKDHLISHVSEKKTMKEIFNALFSLYQSQNINMKMILQNKLRSIVMTKSNTITDYLMKITQSHDKLVAVEEKVEDVVLVNMTLDGFPTSCEPFVKGICAWEKNIEFERL